ncbi:FAD-dependent oxidoreductase [Saccharopolyspora gloriosae]|uniref:FAD-dependent oxidoreductase n=1 Tax=Saccharopolyspora gloriosae TaxID=455344 RepID=UPI00161B8F96
MTLLGDAAHLMSQFGGFGVNLALLDAVELARALAGSSTVDSPIFRCEKIMMVRSDPLAGGQRGSCRLVRARRVRPVRHPRLCGGGALLQGVRGRISPRPRGIRAAPDRPAPRAAVLARHHGCRWDRWPSWSRMVRISAGPPWAPKACGVIVENWAA